MNVLLIVPYLYDGGAERVASIWASKLAENEQDNVVLLTYWKLEKEYYVDSRVKRISFYNKERELYDYHNLEMAKQIKKIVKENDIDVIIPFTDYPCVHASLACLFNRKVKVIHTIRVNPWVYPQTKKKRLVRDIFTKLDKYLIVQTEEQFEYYNDKSFKYCVIPNPINPVCDNVIKEYSGRLERIVCVGRMALFQKNFEMTIDVVNRLNSQGHCIAIDIYGDGPDREKLQKLIDNAGLSNQIVLKGNISNIIEEEAKYDLFLMTSNFEGFPNSLLEAMSVGMPVISTNCKTGPSSMIDDGINGYLVDVNDSQKASEIIMQLSENPEKLREIGMKAREDMYARFSVEKNIPELRQFLLSVCEK